MNETETDEIERELKKLKRMVGNFIERMDEQKKTENKEDDEIEKERKRMKEIFIKAIENGEKIKKKDFYIYLTLYNIKEVIDIFIDKYYKGTDNEVVYKNLCVLTKPLADKLNTIQQDKNIEQNLSVFFLTLRIDMDKKNIQLFLDMLVDMERYYRGSFSHIRECLIDSEGDATEMFLGTEDDDQKIDALRTIVERRKEVKIEVFDKKFKGDIDKLDNVLKKCLRDTY
ncbi:MAG: hypothetical protein BWK75_03745 [Candidatus Altiarchaeales archaeon A3]|nr:MAG: hypothetical protein BWK75_03745 [Candidatus Altiarchaeales archaeon A3]